MADFSGHCNKVVCTDFHIWNCRERNNHETYYYVVLFFSTEENFLIVIWGINQPGWQF